MFTLTKASQIFPETLAADAVPAITARFRLLSAEDQLALIWYKTSFSGTFHSLRFEKYATRYLGAFCYRFNRRFHLEEMTGRILRATCNCNAWPERILRSAELAT